MWSYRSYMLANLDDAPVEKVYIKDLKAYYVPN